MSNLVTSSSSSLTSGLVLAPFVERFLTGRRVAVLGDATSQLPTELVQRGARLVHVYDPDHARVAQAQASGLPRGVTAAPLLDGDLGVRERAFDLTIVPNLAFFLNPYGLLGRVRQLTSPGGMAVLAIRCDDAAKLQLGYYELYDAAALQFATVKMVGQIPFDGYALVDFAAEDPEVTVDASFADASSREPLSYVVVASERPVDIDGYTIVQMPDQADEPVTERLDLSGADSIRIELTQAKARLEATVAELDAVREGRTVAEAQSFEARRRVQELEQELSVLQGQRHSLAHQLEVARNEADDLNEQLEDLRDAQETVSDRISEARRLGEKVGHDSRKAAEKAAEEARKTAEEATRTAAEATQRAEGFAKELEQTRVRASQLEQISVLAGNRLAELETEAASSQERINKLDGELRRTLERAERAETTEVETRRAAERAAIESKRAIERAEAEARAISDRAALDAQRAAEKIQALNSTIAELRAIPRGVPVAQHQALQTEHTALQEEADQLAADLEQLSAAFRQLQKEAEAQLEAHGREIELAEAALRDRAQRIAVLERQVAEVGALARELINEMESAGINPMRPPGAFHPAPMQPSATQDLVAQRDAEVGALKRELGRALSENDALRQALALERAARARIESLLPDNDATQVLLHQMHPNR